MTELHCAPQIVKVESGRSPMMSATVGDDDAHYKKLTTSAIADSGVGRLSRATELFRKAYELQPSNEPRRHIAKVQQEILAKDSESERNSDSHNKMVHVGNGFYLRETIYGRLYTHQREGVLYLFNLYTQKKGGILGDDMGLGKTIQVISFLSGMYDADLIRSVLLIAPVAVVENWAYEFYKWAPDIYVGKFRGDRLPVQRRGGVLLTTYGVVARDHKLGRYRGKDFVWDYVILDEGQKIKNPANKCAKGVHNISARNRIVLTGTPLMNNLKELWSLFDWTHEGRLLGTEATFAREYDKPIARDKCATAGEQRLGYEMSVNLKSLIKPYILRRTKAEVGILEVGQVSGGTGNAPKMPTLTRKNDLVVWVYLSDSQRQLYSDFLEKPETQKLLVSNKSALGSLTVLKKFCDHPRLMKNRHCNELGLEIAPDVDIDKLDAAAELDSTLFDVSHVPDRLLIKESGKMQFLVELLDNLKEEGHRCLVFSSSRRMLDIVEKVMRGKGHRMCRLDGLTRSEEDRQKIISRFTTDLSYSSFLLTIQLGGIGLTLTAADRVIIIDPSWNPATDSQAVDRAYRIGQKKNVVVYRLITCGTVEEKIYRRQIFKESVNRQTIGDSKNPIRYFSQQELKELFCLDDPTRSTSQEQLAEMHYGKRRTDTQLDAHIVFLHSLDIFGISDHDLMFTVDAANVIEGDADINIDFVKEKVSQAQLRLNTESRQNELMAKETGKYMPITGKEFGLTSIVPKAMKEVAVGIDLAELEMMRRQRYRASIDNIGESSPMQYNVTLVRSRAHPADTVQPFDESVIVETDDGDDEVIRTPTKRKRASSDDYSKVVGQQGGATGDVSPLLFSDDDEFQQRENSSYDRATPFDSALCSTFTDKAASYRGKQALCEPIEETITSNEEGKTVILSSASIPRRDTSIRRRRQSSALFPVSTALGSIASDGKLYHSPVVTCPPRQFYGLSVKPVATRTNGGEQGVDDENTPKTAVAQKHAASKVALVRKESSSESSSDPDEEATTAIASKAAATETKFEQKVERPGFKAQQTAGAEVSSSSDSDSDDNPPKKTVTSCRDKMNSAEEQEQRTVQKMVAKADSGSSSDADSESEPDVTKKVSVTAKKSTTERAKAPQTACRTSENGGSSSDSDTSCTGNKLKPACKLRKISTLQLSAQAEPVKKPERYSHSISDSGAEEKPQSNEAERNKAEDRHKTTASLPKQAILLTRNATSAGLDSSSSDSDSVHKIGKTAVKGKAQQAKLDAHKASSKEKVIVVSVSSSSESESGNDSAQSNVMKGKQSVENGKKKQPMKLMNSKAGKAAESDESSSEISSSESQAEAPPAKAFTKCNVLQEDISHKSK